MPPTSQVGDEGVLSADTVQHRLSELDPEDVNQIYRRSRPLPPNVPDAGVGPVQQMRVGELVDRMRGGETGWQYFYQASEDDPEGAWVEIGRVKPNPYQPANVWIYSPDGLYLDARTVQSELRVRRGL